MKSLIKFIGFILVLLSLVGCGNSEYIKRHPGQYAMGVVLGGNVAANYDLPRSKGQLCYAKIATVTDPSTGKSDYKYTYFTPTVFSVKYDNVKNSLGDVYNVKTPIEKEYYDKFKWYITKVHDTVAETNSAISRSNLTDNYKVGDVVLLKALDFDLTENKTWEKEGKNSGYIIKQICSADDSACLRKYEIGCVGVDYADKLPDPDGKLVASEVTLR